MKKQLITLKLLLTLLLVSGCNLSVSIQGEGAVTDRLSDFACDQSTCTTKNTGDPKRYRLEATPAEGYTSIGLLSKNGNLYRATDGYHLITSIGHLVLAQPVGSDTLTHQGYPANDANTQPIADPETYIPPVPLQVFSEDIQAIFVPTTDINEIFTGLFARCVLYHDESMACWGRNYTGAPTNFSNIYLIEHTDAAFCVADDYGLRCWGNSRNDLHDAPPGITAVKELVFANDKACAIHEENGENQLSCWGRNGDYFPAVNNPTSLRTYPDLPNLMCVTHASGEHCWGEEYYGQAKVPDSLTNVTDFSVGETHTCAIANGSVVCWGWGYEPIPEGISNPTAISTHRSGTCVIEDSGVTCWGYDASAIPPVDELPTKIGVGYGTICFTDSSTLRCNITREGVTILPYNNLKQFEVDSFSACYLDDNNGACLGNTPKNQILQNLDNPQVIGMGYGVLCHYSDAGADCTAKNAYFHPHTDIPPLTVTPSGLTVGFYGACAYENDQGNDTTYFQCWGEDADESWTKYNRGQFSPPAGVGMFSKIESGKYHSCGLTGNQLLCWGEENPPAAPD